jgi:hypothetical protein
MWFFLLKKAVEKWKRPTLLSCSQLLLFLHALCDALSLPIQVHAELNNADSFCCCRADSAICAMSAQLDVRIR